MKVRLRSVFEIKIITDALYEKAIFEIDSTKACAQLIQIVDRFVYDPKMGKENDVFGSIRLAEKRQFQIREENARRVKFDPYYDSDDDDDYAYNRRYMFDECYDEVMHDIRGYFRKGILGRCEFDFENGCDDTVKIQNEKEQIEDFSDEILVKQRNQLENSHTRMRCRGMGNVRLIGELFNLNYLTTEMMMDSIKMLLGEETEEAYERLCLLMVMSGQKLEEDLKRQQFTDYEDFAEDEVYQILASSKKFMTETFKSLKKISMDKKLACRTRLSLLDLIELRKNKWVWDTPCSLWKLF